ncbi:hypothetical protein BOX15_Mlig015308g1, partial [Macrostomum lignano]
LVEMYLYFEFTDTVKNLLFKGWNASTPSGLIIVCLIAGIVTLLYELLMSYHEILMTAANNFNARYQTSVSTNRHIGGPRVKLAYATMSSAVYTVRVLISMLLMLAVMTYNAWIFLSVVLGSAVGYFLSPLARRAFRPCIAATFSTAAADDAAVDVFTTSASSAHELND